MIRLSQAGIYTEGYKEPVGLQEFFTWRFTT
jgi:hypothetical protein